MRINIQVFDHIDDCFQRIRGDSTDKTWAAAAEIRDTTISELRRLSKLLKTNPDAKMGRACTTEKVVSLIGGLIKLKGEEVMRKELKKIIAAEKDEDIKFLLKAIIIMKHGSTDTKKNANTMLDMAIQTIPD